MKKSTPPLTLPGWAWILSETPVLLIPRPHSLPQFTQRRRTRSRAETIWPAHQQNQSGRVDRKHLRVWGRRLIGSKVHKTGLGTLSKFAQEAAERENKQGIKMTLIQWVHPSHLDIHSQQKEPVWHPAQHRGSGQVWRALPLHCPIFSGLGSLPQPPTISPCSWLRQAHLTSILPLVDTSQPVPLLLCLDYDFGVREIGS